MNFDIPEELLAYMQELDDFIDKEITPLQMENDNNRFFDHRREDARTDWERGGCPMRSGKHYWKRRSGAPMSLDTIDMLRQRSTEDRKVPT